MRNLLTILIVALCLIVLTPQAQAAKSGKAAKSSKVGKLSKERLVLMELRLSEGEKNLQGAMETALLEGLQQKYEVFAGEQVKKKAKEIFNKESRTAKHDCNETRCMQDIAEAFQAELIATASVAKQDGGYFLSLKIENIFDNKAVYSKSLPCEGCSSFQAVDKLKELSGVSMPEVTSSGISAAKATIVPAGKESDTETALWKGVRETNRKDDYESYLEQYPQGKYAVLAKSLIKKIQDTADSEEWQVASKSGSKADLKNYLSKYPMGKYSEQAQSRISKLKQDEANAEANKQRESLAQESRQKHAREEKDARIKFEAAEALKNFDRGNHDAVLFKEGIPDCFSCHEKDDAKFHKRRFGKECQQCHNARSWKSWNFDHDKTDFKLTGAHKNISDCYKCHSRPMDKKVKASQTCGGCHDRDDVHNGDFGPQCERCHIGDAWRTVKKQ